MEQFYNSEPYYHSPHRKTKENSNKEFNRNRIKNPSPTSRNGMAPPMSSYVRKRQSRVNPIGLYYATFAWIGRRALLNCHCRQRFGGWAVIWGQVGVEMGVSGWWGRVESRFTEWSLAIDLWVVFGVPWILREWNLNLVAFSFQRYFLKRTQEHYYIGVLKYLNTCTYSWQLKCNFTRQELWLGDRSAGNCWLFLFDVAFHGNIILVPRP